MTRRSFATSGRILPETLAAAVLVPAALVIFVSYLIDALGGPIDPLAMGLVFLVASVCVLVVYREPAEDSRGNAMDIVFCVAVVAVAFAYFLWLASPSWLPVTIGPDVVHHLMLIHLIQRTHHLVHDPALTSYLVEMADYTPGAHVLTALVASWLRVDALRVIHPIAAFCAAMNLGIIYLIALRLIGPIGVRALGGPSWPRVQALTAPALALVPIYTFDAFFHFFYLAQIVSETFALGMLLATVDLVRGGRRALVVWVECGVAAFFTWPVWLGPPVAAFAFAAVFFMPRRFLRIAILALLPLAGVAAIQITVHPGAAGILTSSGAVTPPSVAAFGVAFVACAAVGIGFAVHRSPAAIVLVFLFAVVVQAVALGFLAVATGSRSLYMPFKMMYLLVPAAAILGSVALSRVSWLMVVRVPRFRWAAAAAPVVLVALLLPGRVPTNRQRSAISEEALAAGEWARAHVPTACVDYFSRYWLTGYWLHLDVLGNPRLSDRMRAESFELRDSAGKWVEGRGLPYAFVEDVDAVPKDARVDMSVIHRAGRAAIVQNRRPVPCTDRSRPIWSVR
jgi:hypothetical protein